MAPPSYSDMGKNAKDIFSKGYHFGLIKLDYKTQTESGVEFNTGGTSNQETGDVFGSLETKYRFKDYGVTFSERWNTDNTLGTEISVQDQLMSGLKLAAEVNFSPQTGSKAGRIKSSFANEKLAVNCDVDLNAEGYLVNTAAVVGFQGWLVGYQTAFDVKKKALTKNNLALGFRSEEFTFQTNVDDGQEYAGSIHQQISPQLQSAVSLSWTPSDNNTKFGLGAKYNLDDDAAVRAKVNTASQIGLGYQQRLREGVTLTLSALIDGKNFNEGGHKVGLALEFQA